MAVVVALEGGAVAVDRVVARGCHKPPRYVPYKGTFVPYNGTYGVPDQGQTLDV